MRKKLFAIVMSLTMMLTFTPVMAFAEESGENTGSNVSAITYTPNKTAITLYKGVDETEDEDGNILFDVINAYAFEIDTVKFEYSDGTSETLYLDEFEDWEFVVKAENGEYMSLSEAQQETPWVAGGTYDIFLKAKGIVDTSNRITVTVKANPYENASFSFTQSGKFLYVLEYDPENPEWHVIDSDNDGEDDVYELDSEGPVEYLGSEGDTLVFTRNDNSTIKFEYGYKWEGFFATDDSGNKLSPEIRPEREILFSDNQLRWKKDSNGYYINDSAKLTYMGTVSDKTVKTYVGNMVWFEPEGGDGRANFTVPLGMSVNDLTNTDATDIPIISKSGYSFCGWYEKDPTTGDLKSEPFDFDKKIEEETFLFAKWEEASSSDLDDAKTSAKAELDSYKDAAAYRAAQKTELANAITAGKAAIDAAEDTDGVDAALAEAKASIDKIKTDAELTAEEAAEAARIEQARQGTPVRSIPKVKIKKPKAAKKAVTVKWKKLSKKQLKKSKAAEYEIWVCPNKAFGPNDTIIKTAGKKKASLKVKGLQKGTYYVKVRAVRFDNNNKIVGKWSSVRKVKVKK